MKKRLFINFSNHPSNKWSGEQLAAAKEIAEQIVDRPFPNIPSDWDSKEVMDKVAVEVAYLELELDNRGIIDPDDVVVMVQGEFTFTHAFVNSCANIYLQCIAPIYQHTPISKLGDDHVIVKTKFIKFREYETIV